MSFMYYEVSRVVKKSHSKEFKISRAKVPPLILYIVSAIIFILSYCFALSISIWWWISAGIGFALAVFSLIWAIKREKLSPHDYKKYINKVNEIINEIGLNTEAKIQSLQIEIKESIKEAEINAKQLASLISKLLLLVFWVPLGFLISYWLNNHPNEIPDLKTLGLFIVLLFMLTMLLIGLLMILFSPVNSFILQPLRKEQERVLQYLNDILYYCDFPLVDKKLAPQRKRQRKIV